MKIAIVRLSALGDIFQSMIILQFIKSRYPLAQIDWFVDSVYQDALKENDDIDNIIPINLKKLKKNFSVRELINIIKTLKSSDVYDYVIDIQGLLKSAVIASFIPGRKRFGFDRNSIREKLAVLFYSETFFIPYEENVIKRYIDLLNQALNLKVTTEEILNKKPLFKCQKNNNIRSRKGLIIIGASFKSKIYPVKKFARVVNSLNMDFIVAWKTPKEKEMAIELINLTKRTELSHNLDLSQLKDLVVNSSIVIGGDTGPTHLAWALNIPSITLFGSTSGYRNMFETRINLRLESSSEINPHKIDKNDLTISEIQPQKIIALTQFLLGN